MKSLLIAIWQFGSYLFVPQWGRRRKAEESLKNEITNLQKTKMKEVKIEGLPSDYIEYIKNSIGVPKIINGQKVFYCKNACHVNSVVFCEFINSTTTYHCSVIEGMVVCKDGLAYEHYWNLIRDDNGELEYVDVTMDAIATDSEREVEKSYYEIIEHEMQEMIEKIANKQPLFSGETHKAISDYYAEHPEKEAEYRKGKEMVERQ